ncbi:hypothetical protein HDN1F_11880 [gamma proteobacterium HdN1]|nr:hypothetical protein HDN1F_11880 [gamma proteobacterium HdN1]
MGIPRLVLSRFVIHFAVNGGSMKSFSSVQGSSFVAGLLSIFSLVFVLFSGSVHAAALVVSSTPSDAQFSVGESASFKIVATSSNKIYYNWYKNGKRIWTAAGSTLSLGKMTTGKAGTYHAKVYDRNSYVITEPFVVSIATQNSLAITKQPSASVVNEGSALNVSVTATGSGTLAYQWYFNGAAIPGATGSSISTNSAKLSDAGQYKVVVSNGSSSVTSNTVTLSVMAVAKSYAANLAWTAPTSRDDGSALAKEDIASYNIYFGTSATGSLSKIASLSAADLSYTVSNLSAGTYYFAATAVDRNGLESKLSERISASY